MGARTWDQRNGLRRGEENAHVAVISAYDLEEGGD
jgi:hypothetical protein